MTFIEQMTPEERVKDFEKLFRQYHPEEADEYLYNEPFMNYLKTGGFFTAPASTKYHGVYEGGLYNHSRCVAVELENMTANMGLEWESPESPFIIGMFHDLCKCDKYIKIEEPQTVSIGSQIVSVYDNKVTKYAYNENILLKGHGAKSIMILSQFITLTEEEMLCIRYHMGAYEKEEWNEFDMAIRKYPNVLYAHTADMYASKVLET